MVWNRTDAHQSNIRNTSSVSYWKHVKLSQVMEHIKTVLLWIWASYKISSLMRHYKGPCIWLHHWSWISLDNNDETDTMGHRKYFIFIHSSNSQTHIIIFLGLKGRLFIQLRFNSTSRVFFFFIAHHHRVLGLCD